MLTVKTNVKSVGHTNYLTLIRELTVAEFKLKYQGSVIGYLWSLVKPLAVFGVLYLVFTVFVRIGSTIPHYPIYLLLGIVLWNYFAESTGNAMRCIVDKSDLIRKVYFPRIVLLIASSASALITLLLNMIIIVAFMAGAHIVPSLTGVIVFVLLIAELYVLSLGISLFLAALYVKFRDFLYIWEVALQLLFYASAVIFPLSIVPQRYVKFILLSPLTQILQDARKALISNQAVSTRDVLHVPWVFLPYLIPIVLVLLGLVYFERSAAKFAEEV